MKIQILVLCSLIMSFHLFGGDGNGKYQGKMSYDDSKDFIQTIDKNASIPEQDNSDRSINIQMMIQRNIRMLNDIRKNLTEKSDALFRIKEKMTSKNIPNIDSKIAEISKIIDEAVSMKLSDFEENKQLLAQKIVSQLTESSPEQKTSKRPEPPNRQRPEGKTRGAAIHWIDVHGHLLPDKKDFKTAVESALTVMNESSISKMIFMPTPQCENNQHYDCDAFISIISKYPDRIAFMGGGGTLNVTLHKYANQKKISDSVKLQFEEEAASIIKKGAVGFGEIAIHHISHTQGQPYESVAADHPLMLFLADLAAKYDVPIDVHFDVVTQDMELPAKFSSPPNPKKFTKNIEAFERLLAYNPKTKICWAHAGTDLLGQWTIELSRGLLMKYPNLYMSLRIGPPDHPAGLFTGNNQISQEWLALLNEFPDRFVIGADQFIVGESTSENRATNPQDRNKKPSRTDAFSKKAPVARQMTNLFLNSIPQDLAKKIAYENAMNIYNLKN